MRYLCMAMALVLTLGLHGQDKKAKKFAKSITTKDLKEYLGILASDSLEGRETGERGQKMAAAYIADKFEKWGLEAPVETEEGMSYYQTYDLKKLTYRTAYLKKDGEQKTNFEDFLYYSRAETFGEENIEVVFTGKESIEELKKRDLKGKYVAIINEEMAGWRSLLAELQELDAAGVFMFVEDESRYKFILDRFSGYLSRPRMGLTVDNTGNKIIIGDKALASWMFDKPYEELAENGVGSSTKVVFNADMLIDDLQAENVLGFLKGSEKPDEILVITAHYDHIGISADGQINNGADDDGSGTSSVMEIAQAFAMAAKKGNGPKRSVLFMCVSGEEKGLLGSKYYTDNPVFPMENTVANLNIDMVGRVDEAHKDNPYYVYVIGSDKLSQDLHLLSEQVNKTYSNLAFDYTYNDENDPNRYYYRSDHYNFAKKNVPIIFYFNGTHEDYHRPTDTIEKIHFDKMQKIAELVFFTAWEVANREERIKLDEEIVD